MSPMSPTKIAKVKEKPGSPFRNLRLFSISCGEKKKTRECQLVRAVSSWSIYNGGSKCPVENRKKRAVELPIQRDYVISDTRSLTSSNVVMLYCSVI